MNILLVTGSRTLTGDLVLVRVREVLAPLLQQTDLLVCGDAVGIDQIALWQGHDNAVDCEVWRTNGVLVKVENNGSKWTRWRDYGELDPKRAPLVRNAAMVQSVADKRSGLSALRPMTYRGDGYEVNAVCVGFVDPDSPTHGTDHTLGLSRKAGIWCARYVWNGDRFEEQS